jgi:hypothetical protein
MSTLLSESGYGKTCTVISASGLEVDARITAKPGIIGQAVLVPENASPA